MPSLSPPEEPPAPVAIVLLQLGGPSSLDEVQPFLENMFRDPELFNLPIPAWVQDWLAGRVSSGGPNKPVRCTPRLEDDRPSVRSLPARQTCWSGS